MLVKGLAAPVLWDSQPGSEVFVHLYAEAARQTIVHQATRTPHAQKRADYARRLSRSFARPYAQRIETGWIELCQQGVLLDVFFHQVIALREIQVAITKVIGWQL